MWVTFYGAESGGEKEEAHHRRALYCSTMACLHSDYGGSLLPYLHGVALFGAAAAAAVAAATSDGDAVVVSRKSSELITQKGRR